MAPDNETSPTDQPTAPLPESAEREPGQVAGEAQAIETPAADPEQPAPAKRATRARKTTTKRAPRKATAKAAAPAPAPEMPETPATGPATGEVDDATDMLGTPGTDSAEDDARAAADAVAPAKKAPAKRTRRATAKASAPRASDQVTESARSADADLADVPGLTSGTPEDAADDESSTPATASAVEQVAQDADAVAEETAQAAEPIDAGESDAEVTDLAVAVLEEDELDELIATIPVTPAEPPAAASPFGLLFQAPEPAPRRNRRATSPSGDPAALRREDEQDDEHEEPTADETGADRTDDRDGDDDQDRGPRRRRRGGKGRRRGGEEDEPEQSGAEDETDEDADGDDETDRSDDEEQSGSRRSRRRRGRGRKGGQDHPDDDRSDDDRAERSGKGSDGKGSDDKGSDDEADDTEDDEQGSSSSRRRRRRRRSGSGSDDAGDPPGTVTKVRERRREEATGIKGSTRLEAKKQRRREGREAGRRRTIITEAEFLARREAVERTMVVRDSGDRTQIAVLEDGVLVEHYVSREQSASSTSIAGNIYLGRVQNVLPSMEAAFVDIGKGRNAVLYAGEVNWDAAGLENGQPRRIENALKSGDTVLVQATKDPIGHKGARLTSQISLPGRYLVFVPGSSMMGISRKLPDTERARLKKILKEVMPSDAGVIVRTAAEGASEEELRADVTRLTSTWEDIQTRSTARSTHAPALLHGEPDLTVRVIRDVFNEDFSSLVVAGDAVWQTVSAYVESVAPDLAPRLQRWTGERDVFAEHRVDEQLSKAMDRKVWLPSGGSLVIDRTEAMTVIDVNTGKFVGQGGNLEETVTKNNIEAAEEIVRQLRLRDIGGIIVVDFIDMVLESNRDLVVRRLVECLGRDRTKHQVAEVTSLGLVQMTRKRVGTGLIESFSTTCEHCNGRGILISSTPVPAGTESGVDHSHEGGGRRGRGKGKGSSGSGSHGSGDRHDKAAKADGAKAVAGPAENGSDDDAGPTPAQIAAAAHAAAMAASRSVTEDDQPASPDEVAKAIDEAMESVLGHDALTPAPQEDEVPVRRRGRRAAAAEASTPAPAPAPEPVSAPEPASAPEPVSEREPEVPAVPQAAAAEEPAPEKPRRRRRGRVVAPAGPPTGAAQVQTLGVEDESSESSES